jgi:hypothetical protein
MVEKGIVLMLVASAIDRLAIQLAWRSRAIFSVGFERAGDVRKWRLWKRADGGSFLRTWCGWCREEVAVRWLPTTHFSRSGAGPVI